MKRWRRLWVVITMLGVTGSCVDTTLTDLTKQLGSGPTDGPFCTAEVIDELPPETLKITILDVGQGDAVWVQTPWFVNQDLESEHILIDTGPQANGSYPGGQFVVDYLLSHGVSRGEAINAVVVTHAHDDHWGGLPEVAANFNVRTYIDPGFTANKGLFIQARNDVMAALTGTSGLFSAPAVPKLGQWYDPVLVFGNEVSGRLLGGSEVPPSGNTNNPTGTEINNTSVVLSVTWRSRQVLFMGDAEQEVEARLVADHDAGKVNLAASVLKVGHHGSGTSSTAAFLDRVFPTKKIDDSWAIISSGRKSFGGTQLPDPATVTRLASYLSQYHLLSTESRDDQKSAGDEHRDDHVIVLIDGDGLTSACYAPQ